MESTQPLPLCSHSALSQAVSYLTLETLLSHAVQSWLTQNSCLKTLQISKSKKKYSAKKTFWSSLLQCACRMCTLQNKSHVSRTGYFTVRFSTGLSSAGPLSPSPSPLHLLLYIPEEKTQPLSATFPTLYPYRLLSRDRLWPEGPLASAQRSLTWHVSERRFELR